MATAAKDLPLAAPSHRAAPAQIHRPPVRYWAALGAVVLAFITYVMVKWVTGPNFKSIDPGPTPLPGWMEVSMVGWQIVTPIITAYAFWWALIRPWRREREITTDGLLVICFLTMWFQDPLSAYFGNYFNNNAYMLNMGSWVNEIPGWHPVTEPGTGIVEPPLFTAGTYVWMMLIGSMGCCALMTRMKARRPTISPVTLVGATWFLMFLFDLVFEGLVAMPLGLFAYGGGHWNIFPDSYHKFPIHEAIFFGAIMTSVGALRYFKNDRGETLVERGITDMRATPWKKVGLRFLALLAACQMIFLLTFNVPVAIIFGSRPTAYPADLQSRSYLMGGICGVGTDRACPGPGIPLARGKDTIHLDPNGRLVVPEGRTLPKQTPFSTEARGPFHGSLF